MATKIYTPYEYFTPINKKLVSTVYFVYGPEEYLKEKVIDMIKQQFCWKQLSDFDRSIFYGDEDSAVTIIEQLETLPFLADKQLVLLKDFDKLKADDKSRIASYTKNPYDSSIFVIIADKTDTTATYKQLHENALCIFCKLPYDSKEIIKWMKDELAIRRLTMDMQAIVLFSNMIHVDFLTAKNELEKLELYIGERNYITEQDVYDCTGKSRTSSVFELQDALGKKDLQRALVIYENLYQNGESGVFIISILNTFFMVIWKIIIYRKMNYSDNEIVSDYIKEIHTFFRKNYIQYAANYQRASILHVFSLLMQSDADLKSINVDERLIIEMLIINICKEKHGNKF